MMVQLKSLSSFCMMVSICHMHPYANDVIFVKLPRFQSLWCRSVASRVEAGTWKTVLCNHFQKGTCTRGQEFEVEQRTPNRKIDSFWLIV